MRLMWDNFGKEEIGYTSTQLKDIIEGVAQADLTDFFNHYLYSTKELPFNEYFEPFGLELQPIIDKNAPPYLGMNIKNEAGKELITFVTANSPAALAGIDVGDELLALEGWKVTSETICDRLKDYQIGNMVNLTVFHEEKLNTLKVKLEAPKPQRYEVKIIKNCSPIQKEMLKGFLDN